MKNITANTVNEDSSCKLQFTITDYDGTGVSYANISSATLSLYNDAGEIVNSREDVDINSVTYINGSGVCTFPLVAADHAITSTDYPASENRIAVIAITCTSGSDTIVINEEIKYKVIGLRNV